MKTYFVLRYPNGMLVAIDSNSGGYPYETDNPNQVRFWPSIEEPERYKRMFTKDNFSIIEIVISAVIR